MTKNKKKKVLALSTLSLATVLGVGAASFAASKNSNAVANSDTVWGHYSLLRPTKDTAGSVEFWVSCDDHSIKYTAPEEAEGIVEDRGAPTVEMVESWGANDPRYRAAFGSEYLDYLTNANHAFAWGEEDGVHLYSTRDAAFGIPAAKVNALIAKGVTEIGFKWTLARENEDTSNGDEIVFFTQTTKWVEHYASSGYQTFTLHADEEIQVWSQRNHTGEKIEMVFSDFEVFNPTAPTLEQLAYTKAAFYGVDANNDKYYPLGAPKKVELLGTWMTYLKKSFVTELIDAGYNAMILDVTIPEGRYLGFSYDGGNTVEYLYEESGTYHIELYLPGLTNPEGGLWRVCIRPAQEGENWHNGAVATGGTTTMTNIQFANSDDVKKAYEKKQARARLAGIMASEGQFWKYIRHTGWGSDCTYGENAVVHITGGVPLFQDALLKDLAAAEYKKVHLHMKAVAREGRTVTAMLITDAVQWQLYSQRINGDDLDLTVDFTKYVADVDTYVNRGVNIIKIVPEDNTSGNYQLDGRSGSADRQADIYISNISFE